MRTICLDFGTSSIRAALREGDSGAVPLRISPESSIDNASIPSAIFVSKDSNSVSFGEEALKKGLQGRPSILFETSPKKWLGPDFLGDLGKAAFYGAGVSRGDLIAALLSLAAVEAHRAACTHLGKNFKKFEYRIAHPVWLDRDRSRVAQHYRRCLAYIDADAGAALKHESTRERLRSWVKKGSALPLPAKASAHCVDVEEPVAASLELVDNPGKNQRSVYLVIDVGAGTIDIALFYSLVPGELADHARRKLVAITEPRSIFGAGDKIDAALIGLIDRNFPLLNSMQRAELRNNIRRKKEQLFDDGEMTVQNGKVSLDDLERTSEIAAMQQGLSKCISAMLISAGIERLDGTHALERIDVIFAGGGANISFLRRAVQKAIKRACPEFRTDFIKLIQPARFQVDASRTRMAVAMGGTTPYDEWPQGRVKLTEIPALAPFQPGVFQRTLNTNS